jgi:hypothetical protein
VTEADWLSCVDPQPMLEYLRGTVSERKLRLFAVACVRRVERLLREKEGLVALQLAERMAEGPVPLGRPYAAPRGGHTKPGMSWLTDAG